VEYALQKLLVSNGIALYGGPKGDSRPEAQQGNQYVLTSCRICTIKFKIYMLYLISMGSLNSFGLACEVFSGCFFHIAVAQSGYTSFSLGVEATFRS
jgi:hypothetical protein